MHVLLLNKYGVKMVFFVCLICTDILMHTLTITNTAACTKCCFFAALHCIFKPVFLSICIYSAHQTCLSTYRYIVAAVGLRCSLLLLTLLLSCLFIFFLFCLLCPSIFLTCFPCTIPLAVLFNVLFFFVSHFNLASYSDSQWTFSIRAIVILFWVPCEQTSN